LVPLTLAVSVFPGVVFPFAAVDPFPLVLITVRVAVALPLEVTGFVLPAVVVAVVVGVVVTVIIVRDGRPESGRDDGDAWWFSLEARGPWSGHPQGTSGSVLFS
jgi:hypothetical protein